VAKICPTAWWKGFCSNQELSKIASKILNLPSTTAAVERFFSTYGIIHTAKRNKLSNERAAKLVFISQNIKYSTTAVALPPNRAYSTEKKTCSPCLHKQCLSSLSVSPSPCYMSRSRRSGDRN